MEIKIIKKPRFKTVQVPDGEEDVKIYVASNGIEHASEFHALAYEARLAASAFKQRYHYRQLMLDVSYHVLYIPEVTAAVTAEVSAQYRNLDSLYVGWNLIHEDNSGDRTWSYGNNLDDMLKDLQKDLARLLALKAETPDAK